MIHRKVETRVFRADPTRAGPKGLIGPGQSPYVMALPDKHLVYVLGHPEAWKLLVTLEQGPQDRYEQVRKTLGMHSQAFQRLLYWMRGFGLVRIRAEHTGRAHRGAVPVHLEISPKGQAMLELLRRVEEEVQNRREALGVRTADLLTVA
jgi:hypothetical protein